MKKFSLVCCSTIVLFTACKNSYLQHDASDFLGSTKTIAHRGYWDCENSAQNSIYALKMAQEAEIYGSEFDVRITSDTIPIVNHDPTINELLIENTPFVLLKNYQLINGEYLPTLASYLEQGKKNKTTKLFLEIKPHSSKEKEDLAVRTITQLVKKMSVDSWVEYISFSLNICKELVRLDPKAKVAYLEGDLAPEEIKLLNFSGINYHYNVYHEHMDWIEKAKKLGLTVNVWTVNDQEHIQEMISAGVDFITTDKPLVVKDAIKGNVP